MKFIHLVLLWVLAASTVGNARAAPILDQSNPFFCPSCGISWVDHQNTMQQGVTAGVAGRLAAVELFVGNYFADTSQAVFTLNPGAPWHSGTDPGRVYDLHFYVS